MHSTAITLVALLCGSALALPPTNNPFKRDLEGGDACKEGSQDWCKQCFLDDDCEDGTITIAKADSTIDIGDGNIDDIMAPLYDACRPADPTLNIGTCDSSHATNTAHLTQMQAIEIDITQTADNFNLALKNGLLDALTAAIKADATDSTNCDNSGGIVEANIGKGCVAGKAISTSYTVTLPNSNHNGDDSIITVTFAQGDEGEGACGGILTSIGEFLSLFGSVATIAATSFKIGSLACQ